MSNGGRSACVQLCAPGQFRFVNVSRATAGVEACYFCPAGKFQPHSGQQSCLKCALGKNKLNSKKTKCTPRPQPVGGAEPLKPGQEKDGLGQKKDADGYRQCLDTTSALLCSVGNGTSVQSYYEPLPYIEEIGWGGLATLVCISILGAAASPAPRAKGSMRSPARWAAAAETWAAWQNAAHVSKFTHDVDNVDNVDDQEGEIAALLRTQQASKFAEQCLMQGTIAAIVRMLAVQHGKQMANQRAQHQLALDMQLTEIVRKHDMMTTAKLSAYLHQVTFPCCVPFTVLPFLIARSPIQMNELASQLKRQRVHFREVLSAKSRGMDVSCGSIGCPSPVGSASCPSPQGSPGTVVNQATSSEHCPVCLIRLSSGEVRKLPCGHRLHSVCCEKWEHTQARLLTSCPVCRKDFL